MIRFDSIYQNLPWPRSDVQTFRRAKNLPEAAPDHIIQEAALFASARIISHISIQNLSFRSRIFYASILSMARLQPKSKIYDVVVIGSGAGGGTVVHTLTKMGVEVALMEAGPMVDPSKDFKEHMWPHEVDHRGAEDGAPY